MRLAWLSVVAVLVGRAPVFADGTDAPPPAPPPSTDLSTATAPAPAPVSDGPPGSSPPAREVDGGNGFRPKPMRDIVIEVPGDRDANNIGLLVGLGLGGALLGGIGVYFNLDSKTAADAVSPKHPTNSPWTAADQAEVDQAHSSAVKAGVFYGLGGAVLIGAVVAYIATAPKSETTIIHPHYARVQPIIAPTPTGAVLGGAWSF